MATFCFLVQLLFSCNTFFFLLYSPRGDRLRSRVELASVLEGVLDLSNFEYKTGKFYNGEAPPTRVRNRAKVLASVST